MRDLILRIALATLIAGSAATALAQGQGQGQRQRNQNTRTQQMAGSAVQTAVEAMAAKFDPLALIYRKDVQLDLGLDLGQRNKIDNLHDRQLKEIQDYRIANRRNRGTMPEFEEKHRKETQDKIDELLTDGQKARLKEISIQLQGNAAVTSADIQKKLATTPEQNRQFTELLANRDAQVSELQRQVAQREMSPQDIPIRLDQIQKDFNEALGAVLTQEQADKLKAMGGKPFKPAA